MATWLVCGGKRFRPASIVHQVLDKIMRDRGRPDILVHGNNGIKRRTRWIIHGADVAAGEWALSNGIAVHIYPPRPWLDGCGLKGQRVNHQRMLDQEFVELVIAFQGGKEVDDMTNRARAEGIEVIEAVDEMLI